MLRRRFFNLTLLCSVCFILLPSFTNAAYYETFDTGPADFHYGYGSNYTDGTVNWSGTEGNPDGHISGLADNLYAIWVYDEDVPGNSFGDMTDMTLSIDTKVTGTTSGNAQFYVGREGSFYIGFGTWSITNDSSWTTHSILLDANNLTVWTGANNGASLAYVLAAPDDIGIFFGGLTASGEGALAVDNFGTGLPAPVPVPGAAWLLVSGIVGLAGFKRRMSSF